MAQRMMVRSFLAGLVSLSLLAAPAAVAGPAQPADSPRSGWMVEFGDLISRAVGLLFDDWSGEREVRDLQPPDDADPGIRSISGADEGGSSWDPDG